MDLDYLKKTALFKNMTDAEIRSALKALQADEKSYARNETILHAGSRTDRMGLVLSGNVRIESTDIWGNRTLLNKTGPGHYFAESYALLPEEPMLVDAVADGRSGRLITQGDYAAFASAVLQVLADGKAGWEHRATAFADDFAWPVFGGRLMDALSR